MSMTSGISFFDKNRALFKDGATCAASSNTDLQNLILGTNKYFRWESSGSDDMTTETLTITLPSAIEISRIFLIGHNFDDYGIQYDNGSPADFTGVTGLNSYSGSSIAETGYTGSVSYYEFTPVTTDTIIITIDTTQVADAEKYLTQFVATNELGTLTGYPTPSPVSLDRNERKEKSISGRAHIQKGYETASFDLKLNTYPVQADVDILDSLQDREDPFLVWLCGGKPSQFRIEQRGYRLEDVYQMQIDAPLKNSYDRNIYQMGANQSYSFMEVV